MKRYTLLFGILLFAAIPPCHAWFTRPAVRIPAFITVRVTDGRASETTNDTAQFVLHRSLNTQGPLVVSYRISGTAANGVDYDQLTGSARFEAGQSTATVVVKPIDDSIMERAETVTLRLVPSRPGQDTYRIGWLNLATIIIRDNDTALPEEIVLAPRASGTVVRWPELGEPDLANETMLQSHYRRTTADNRQFRRAFLEFEIPAVPRGILNATLLIADESSGNPTPVPPVTHELSAYSADLAISVSDYDQPTLEVTTFETDANNHEETFSLDLTEVVRMFEGRNLGLRIKLAVDPDYSAMGFTGAGFQGIYNGFPPRLVITTPRN